MSELAAEPCGTPQAPPEPPPETQPLTPESCGELPKEAPCTPQDVDDSPEPEKEPERKPQFWRGFKMRHLERQLQRLKLTPEELEADRRWSLCIYDLLNVQRHNRRLQQVVGNLKAPPPDSFEELPNTLRDDLTPQELDTVLNRFHFTTRDLARDQRISAMLLAWTHSERYIERLKKTQDFLLREISRLMGKEMKLTFRRKPSVPQTETK
jgi:hypothetical protein